MNRSTLLKFFILTIFLFGLGVAESYFSKLSSSAENSEYSTYYKNQASKPYLTEADFELLKNTEAEYFDTLNAQPINNVILVKLIFFFLFGIVFFVYFKYVHVTKIIWHYFLAFALSFLAIAGNSSFFEVIIYLFFCLIGAVSAWKYNKQINQDK